MKKKVGLALGAGGSRGVAHIGVIKALEEEGIIPDYISGCSMGSVVGACYARGMTTEEMLAAVKKIKARRLMDLSLNPIRRKSLMRGGKLSKILIKNIGKIDFKDLKIPFCCVASDMYSGKCVTLDSGLVAEAVKASSTIPTVFPPVKLGDKYLIDGGVLCRVPTEQVKAMGADVVIAVDVLTNTEVPVENVKNIFSVITRVFDMMDNNGSNMKKHILGTQNELWLEPEMKGLSQYEIKDMDGSYKEGYECAKAHMQEIKNLIS